MSYPVGRSVFQGALLFAVWGGGAVLTLVWMAWGWAHEVVPGWRAGLAGAAVLAAGAGAVSLWRSQPVGRLAWDGQVWRWESGRYSSGITDYRLAVVADWQGRLVLRLVNAAGAPLWLWPERRAFPERWPDLRRAVYSPHRATHPHAGDGSAPAGPSPAVAASVSLRNPDSLSHSS